MRLVQFCVLKQNGLREGNYKPVSLTDIDIEVVNKILADQIQQSIRKRKRPPLDQIGFICLSQQYKGSLTLDNLVL